MKKIELNAPLRFVLIVLIWLLTLTVVNLTGTLNNGGAGLIGTLVLYVGALYLSFVYFNDCALKKACKLSLLVMVILAIAYLTIQCYGYILDAFEINNRTALRIENSLASIFLLGKNITIIVFLLITIITTLNADCECKKECCCKDEAKETKEVEAPKEEAKEETTEETKEVE